jgi:hypothetical protein
MSALWLQKQLLKGFLLFLFPFSFLFFLVLAPKKTQGMRRAATIGGETRRKQDSYGKSHGVHVNKLLKILSFSVT